MRSPLAGQYILVVEDEPLIALGIVQELKAAGANIVTGHNRRTAQECLEGADIAGAVLDHSLGDGDSTDLCALLKERNIPFVVYSGMSGIDDACHGGIVVEKPARPGVLLRALETAMSKPAVQS